MNPPYHVEYLRSEVRQWWNATHVQVMRLRATAEREFDYQQLEIDLHFLLVALKRLERCARKIGDIAPELSDEIEEAADAFERAIPGLTRMRDSSEHIDEYAVGLGRRNKQVEPWTKVQEAGLGISGGVRWLWVDEELVVEDAYAAAAGLRQEVERITRM